MMKYFFQQLRSFWFAIMTPPSAPLTTIHQRETMRKRRLLSLILLMNFLCALPFAPLLFFLPRFYDAQMGVSILACGFPLLALWVNRRGYLQCASLLYLLSSFLLTVAMMMGISHTLPIASLFLWPLLLVFLVAAQLFLPAWGPVLMG